MALKDRPIKELNKLDNNPRFIRDEDFKKLCESIERNPDYFKARPLILSNRTGEFIILAGNQRYEAAKKLGLKKVPTYLIEGLTEERERELIIRDNVSNGEWDWDIITNEFDAEELEEWGLDTPDNWSEEDYSDKNKEIDIDELSDKMILKLEFNEDEYSFVLDQLSKINASKEIAILEKLGYES